MTIGTHLLGRHLEHDPRSRAYGVTRQVVTKRNTIHSIGPHLNQADLGSCEGNTAAEWLNWDHAAANRQAFRRTRTAAYLDETDAIALYSEATRLDNREIPGRYPPTDTGTTALGIAKAMQTYDAITAYSWTFDFASFLAQLQNTPIMLGTNWYAGMFTLRRGGYVAPRVKDKEPDGGHAYLAFAVDFTHSRVGCSNHWNNDDGSPWGITIGTHRGSFWMKMAVLERLLIREQGDSLIPAVTVSR